LEKSGELGKDLLGGFGLDERLGVLVSLRYPGADVFLECLDWAVIWAAQQVVGQIRERSLDLVDLAGVGGRVVDLEAGMLLEPAADRGALVRGVVVTDQVHVEIVGDQAVDLLKRNFWNSTVRWRGCRLLITVPCSVLNAANRLVVPWRR
jgi:hypothetical protein